MMNKMTESAQQRGLATKFAKELGIEPHVAQMVKKLQRKRGNALQKIHC
jgi:hypothetical protein